MELGDIVNILAPGDGYWKGKITEINDRFTHTYKDGGKAVVEYSKPIATVHAIKGTGYALVNATDIEMKGEEWFEKGIGKD
jgi:hypothetical protein